jgi:hypothetical protein
MVKVFNEDSLVFVKGGKGKGSPQEVYWDRARIPFVGFIKDVGFCKGGRSAGGVRPSLPGRFPLDSCLPEG